MPASYPSLCPCRSGSEPRTAISSSCDGKSPAAEAAALLAPDYLDEFAQAAAEGTSARLVGPIGEFDALTEDAGRSCGRSAAERRATSSSRRAARAQPRGIDIRQDQLMANITGSLAAQEVTGLQFRRELAAALSRHGIDRLPPGADVCPTKRRPALAIRFRAPPAAMAVSDLSAARHHHLRSELRLRPGRPPRANPVARKSIDLSCLRMWRALAPI